MKYKLVIIGGGAAGIMAAISSARVIPGEGIIIVEKNPALGRKIAATGNGRCNLSNKFCKWEGYGGSNQHAKGAFKKLNPKDTVELFHELGVLTRQENEGRLYPYSEQAISIISTLEDELKSKKVNVLLNSEVKEVKAADPYFIVRTKEGDLEAEAVLIATGGKAGLRFGSTGDGYGFAKGFGHTLCRPLPGLVQIITDDRFLHSLKGVRSKGTVSLKKGKKLIAKEEGEIQFTGKGLSGICVFNISRYLKEDTAEYRIQIDLIPEYSLDEVLNLLIERKKNMKDRGADSLLKGILKEKLVSAYLETVGIDAGMTVGHVDRGRLLELAKLLKDREVAVKGTGGWVDAQVTVGGVDCSEVYADTLESKKISGLFFAGEVLDVDGKCGGWNLQWAWSSGWTAGFYAGKFCL